MTERSDEMEMCKPRRNAAPTGEIQPADPNQHYS